MVSSSADFLIFYSLFGERQRVIRKKEKRDRKEKKKRRKRKEKKKKIDEKFEKKYLIFF